MKLTPVIRLMRWDKPVGIYLLLWPTLSALWIASHGAPQLKNILIFTFGVILTRSAGCVINDYADRNYDIHVARTKARPITAGEISPRQALILFGLLLTLSFFLVLLTNILTIMLAFGAVLLMSVYPFVKRFSNMPQMVLGIAFSWAIPMAFAAETDMVNYDVLWLMMATICWAIAYDTIYAMVDRVDDIKVGIKSSAILFGRFDLLWIAVFQVLMHGCLILAGMGFELGYWYYVGVALSFLLAGYLQWLIRKREPVICFKAFLLSHYQGLLVFLGVVLFRFA